MKTSFYILIFSFITVFAYGQKDSLSIKTKDLKIEKITEYNALSPSRAAFYSLILPGAGQIYNNRYWWQLPLIYGGLGFSIYSYIDSNNKYNRYRTAYKLRQYGLSDEFTREDGFELVSDAGLENAQEQYNYNRNMSLLSAVIVYVLQIVEASVRAHLLQFDTSKDLSLMPSTSFDIEQTPKVGLTLKYNF